MTNPGWKPLLDQCVRDCNGNYSAAGARLGISRAAASTLHRGCYPSPNTVKVGQKIVDAMSRIECPHLATWIAGTECRAHRERACPTGSAMEVRHWRACQACHHNPSVNAVVNVMQEAA